MIHLSQHIRSGFEENKIVRIGKLVLSIALAALCGSSSCGWTKTPSPLTEDEQSFLSDVGGYTVGQIKIASQVAARSHSSEIRTICQRRVISDSNQLNQIRAVARDHGLPTTFTPDVGHNALINHFKTMQLKDVNQDWVGLQIQDNLAKLTYITEMSKSFSAPDVKKLAASLATKLNKDAYDAQRIAPNYIRPSFPLPAVPPPKK